MAAVLACTLLPQGARAIPASPHPFEVVQPDGTVITLHVRGDEYFNWWEDLNGYTVIRDGERYVYARPGADGRLEPAGAEVGKVDPALTGVSRRVLPSLEQRAKFMSERMAPSVSHDGQRAAVPTTGAVKNVVILLQFSNHASRPLPTQGDYDVIFNSPTNVPGIAPTGSVRKVYLEDSYGQLEINSTVFGWYLLPETEQFYAHGSSGLGPPKDYILDALDAADADIDFSLFDEDSDGFVDAIAFIHSGYGAEFGGTDVDGTAQTDRIWSHRSNIPTWTSAEGVKVQPYHISSGLWSLSGSDPGRIGVIAHESGHFFGLPDLYDTNGGGEGIGSWGMMANSWGFDGTQLHPPHFCAWSKIQLGWLTPTVISAPGAYSISLVELVADVYRIDAGFPAGEYLLIENRQPFGHETAMPQGGLAIFHIDDTTSYSNEGYPGQSGWPQNGNHYRVALLQADGNYTMEKGGNRGDGGDVYRGGSGGVTAINSDTTPNTDAYQGGNVFPTGHSIWGISPAGSVMSFNFGLQAPLAASAPDDVRKNRYVSFIPNNSESSAAFQVEMTSGVGPAGVVGWVSAPSDPSGNGVWVSSVVDAPVLRTWPEDVIHVGDCEIVPVSTYLISASVDGVVFSDAVEVGTILKPGALHHGDIVGVNTGTEYTPPQLVANVTDVQALLFCMQEAPNAPPLTWCDLHGNGTGTPPNYLANVSDLQVILKGLEGLTYLAAHLDNVVPADCP